MSNLFARMFDRFRGSGSAAITLPPMDGALRPNTRIDEAEEMAAVTAPDNIALGTDGILLSSGARLLGLSPSKTIDTLWTASSDIVCLAAHPSGMLALGLDEGRLVIRGGAHDGREFTKLGDLPIVSPSALAFADDNTLFVCLGSQDHGMSDWKVDLMTHSASGSVWKIDLGSGAAACMAQELAFPYGVHVTENGNIVVSESWRHRLLRISPDGKIGVVVDELPGYPARMAHEREGGDFGFQSLLRARNLSNSSCAKTNTVVAWWIRSTLNTGSRPPCITRSPISSPCRAAASSSSGNSSPGRHRDRWGLRCVWMATGIPSRACTPERTECVTASPVASPPAMAC